MLAYTYIEKGKLGLTEKPKPKITDARDAIVRVTLVASAPVTCISSTEVYLAQYSEQPSDMKW